MPAFTRCQNCGKSIRRKSGPGRPRKWCSRGCRQRAYMRRRLLDAEERGREAAIEELKARRVIA
jgi:hypothetical protein